MNTRKAGDFALKDIRDLTGYVVIVTGGEHSVQREGLFPNQQPSGNQGVGFATTFHLAKHHARVYLAARSEAKARRAIEDMRRMHSGVDVRFLPLDLQDMNSVKAAATLFLQQESRLDILIHNAAVSAPKVICSHSNGFSLDHGSSFRAYEGRL
jgi:NAD(P)-dependent dehydrogenase (short-subunit alcohol dehydrogenase family)